MGFEGSFPVCSQDINGLKDLLMNILHQFFNGLIQNLPIDGREAPAISISFESINPLSALGTLKVARSSQHGVIERYHSKSDCKDT
jgi:hypothetical protein